MPVDDAVRAWSSQALGANEPALLALIVGIPVIIGVLFNGWQGYQDDDEDFFDTYDSVRLEPRAPDRCSRPAAPRRMRRPPEPPNRAFAFARAQRREDKDITNRNRV